MEDSTVESQPVVQSEVYRHYLETHDKYTDHAIHFNSLDQLPPDTLEQLIQTPGTLYAGDLPVSVSIEAASEILDVSRCKGMAKDLISETADIDTQFSLLPMSYILENPDVYRETLAEGQRRLIFCEFDGVGKPNHSVPEGVTVHSLVNPRTHTSASLMLYQMIDIIDTDPAKPRLDLGEVVETQEVAQDQSLEDGGVLRVRKGGTFTEEEKSQLWDLFSTRFQDISANMPVKLEENEDDTKSELFSNPQYTFVFTTTDKNTIDCCAFMTARKEEYPWISDDFLEVRNQEIEAEYGERPYEIFVPGIAAHRGTRQFASASVLAKIAELAATTNYPVQAVRFESTDVSSLYIPRLVQQAAVANPKYTETSMQKLGQKNYVAVEIAA